MAQALHASLQTVRHIRKKYAEGGLETALHDQPRPGGTRKLTPKGEATLIALACSAPPEERASWTMQRLADKWIELDVVETLSDETGRRPGQVTETRKNPDFAQAMQALAATHYPNAKELRVVLENLRTHTPAAL